MIFVPEKEKCSLWNDELEDRIFIIYDYDKNSKIMFNWYKNKKGEYEPFYLEIYAMQLAFEEGFETMYLQMLTCLEPACQALHQLRYNDVVKKWYCCCPSSMICTKNDDEDELKLFQNMSMNEENGFFDDPVNAIIHWNKDTANGIVNLCNRMKSRRENERID